MRPRPAPKNIRKHMVPARLISCAPQSGAQKRFKMIRTYGVPRRLLAAGCKVLMPWAAPIGTGRGLNDPYSLRLMRERFPEVPLIVDAGLGAPSHAAAAMELGYDGILINTAVARAGDCRVDQDPVIAELHRRGGMGRCPQPGIDDQRHLGKALAHQAQGIGIVQPAAGADRRRPGHQHLAAGSQQPSRDPVSTYHFKPFLGTGLGRT